MWRYYLNECFPRSEAKVFTHPRRAKPEVGPACGSIKVMASALTTPTRETGLESRNFDHLGVFSLHSGNAATIA